MKLVCALPIPQLPLPEEDFAREIDFCGKEFQGAMNCKIKVLLASRIGLGAHHRSHS